MDLTDRSMRNMVCGLGGASQGVPRETGFDITASSEIMAILCLAHGRADLKRRLGNIIVGRRTNMTPVTVRDLGVEGSLTVLLKEALQPNLVQSLERHILNLQQFGLTPVVCINRFPDDTEAEVALVQSISEELGVKAVPADHWATGGEGATELAQAVLDQMDEGKPEISFLYEDGLPLGDKIHAIATRIYHAQNVEFTTAARRQLDEYQGMGFGHLPVCIAKTQYSFTVDSTIKGARPMVLR